MSWDRSKPVLDKLPNHSGNWRDNEVVQTLTGYWDEMLVDLKRAMDQPEFWVSVNARSEYLDYIGLGLCGFGSLWQQDFPDATKQRLIQSYPAILSVRGSRQSIERFIDCVVPGAIIIHFQTPRADISLADLSVVSDYPTARYMICLPVDINRDSREWQWIESAVTNGFPIGDVSIQYQVNLPEKTIAGDWSL